MTQPDAWPDAFLAAVIDTILPGEEVNGQGRPLPAGSRVGLDGRAHAAGHGAVFARIAEAAGGPAGFVAADADRREAVLATVEAAAFAPFRALVNALLADYYEHPDVLACFGWRSAPPQPEGHAIAGADAAFGAALERVRARGPIWRR
ncbi:MAG: hypothetical protein ACK4M0_08800 [Phreatobacter sp.]